VGDIFNVEIYAAPSEFPVSPDQALYFSAEVNDGSVATPQARHKAMQGRRGCGGRGDGGADGYDYGGLTCPSDSMAESNYRIRLSEHYYDEDSDSTYFVYEVSVGGVAKLDAWVLGIPDECIGRVDYPYWKTYFGYDRLACASGLVFESDAHRDTINLYYVVLQGAVSLGEVLVAGHDSAARYKFVDTILGPVQCGVTNDVDDCAGNPCLNGGTCSDELYSFGCTCPDGFWGKRCEFVDDCLNPLYSNLCNNDGVCTDTIADTPSSWWPQTMCDCRSDETGFEGWYCDDEVDWCRDRPCQNGGNCINNRLDFTCECKNNWQGDTCELGLCSTNPCGNGACIDLGMNQNLPDWWWDTEWFEEWEQYYQWWNYWWWWGFEDWMESADSESLSYECNCDGCGFTGPNCDIPVNDCPTDVDPCGENGECQDGYFSWTCNCYDGYSGTTCETADPCVDNQCGDHGTCSPMGNLGLFFCTCEAGFTGLLCDTCDTGFTGPNCDLNIDDCFTGACLNGGTCNDGVNSYTCTCAAGFTGDTCQTNIDDCASSPCVNGVCVDGIASYSCNCAAGYEGDYCESNINDCATDPCLNGGTCNDGVNSYTCTCAAGFTGDNCQTNIDDCVSSRCANGGCFVDGVNSYSCDCTGPGVSGEDCTINIDDCNPSNDCANGASCVDGVGSYSCDCVVGYSGDLCQVDINECEDHACLNGANCLDGIGSYTCDCTNTGFEGEFCATNIDDCVLNPCEHGGSCLDLINDVSCNCDGTGYEGPLCEHNVDDCLNVVCENSGVCEDRVLGFRCDCTDTWYHGTFCELRNESEALEYTWVEVNNKVELTLSRATRSFLNFQPFELPDGDYEFMVEVVGDGVFYGAASVLVAVTDDAPASTADPSLTVTPSSGVVALDTIVQLTMIGWSVAGSSSGLHYRFSYIVEGDPTEHALSDISLSPIAVVRLPPGVFTFVGYACSDSTCNGQARVELGTSVNVEPPATIYDLCLLDAHLATVDLARKMGDTWQVLAELTYLSEVLEDMPEETTQCDGIEVTKAGLEAAYLTFLTTEVANNANLTDASLSEVAFVAVQLAQDLDTTTMDLVLDVIDLLIEGLVSTSTDASTWPGDVTVDATHELISTTLSAGNCESSLTLNLLLSLALGSQSPGGGSVTLNSTDVNSSVSRTYSDEYYSTVVGDTEINIDFSSDSSLGADYYDLMVSSYSTQLHHCYEGTSTGSRRLLSSSPSYLITDIVNVGLTSLDSPVVTLSQSFSIKLPVLSADDIQLVEGTGLPCETNIATDTATCVVWQNNDWSDAECSTSFDTTTSFVTCSCSVTGAISVLAEMQACESSILGPGPDIGTEDIQGKESVSFIFSLALCLFLFVLPIWLVLTKSYERTTFSYLLFGLVWLSALMHAVAGMYAFFEGYNVDLQSISLAFTLSSVFQVGFNWSHAVAVLDGFGESEYYRASKKMRVSVKALYITLLLNTVFILLSVVWYGKVFSVFASILLLTMAVLSSAQRVQIWRTTENASGVPLAVDRAHYYSLGVFALAGGIGASSLYSSFTPESGASAMTLILASALAMIQTFTIKQTQLNPTANLDFVQPADMELVLKSVRRRSSRLPDSDSFSRNSSADMDFSSLTSSEPVEVI
jgi:hypothetical protein